MMIKKRNIVGYAVNTFPFERCSDQIFQYLQEGIRSWLACFNPHSYVLSLEDKVFSRALKDADWLVPDGAGVVWASRLLGETIKARVTGSDVFAGLNQRMNAAGSLRVFFMGSTNETLERIRKRMADDYPNIKIVGTYSPPFKAVYSGAELSAMVKAVNSAAPDVLWVGMSAPKQEKFIYLNKSKLNVKFIGAVGAVFDFYSGKVNRDENSWFVNHGLEWLARLIQEPKRLWQRTLVSAPIFVWHVIKQKVNSEG